MAGGDFAAGCSLSACVASRRVASRRLFEATPGISPVVFGCRHCGRNNRYDSGSYYISPNGYTKSPMCVYCNMTLEGGGWTLVYRYTFNNYGSFTDSSNYVSHIPTWENHDNWASTYDLEALESKVAPRSLDEFGVRTSRKRKTSPSLCDAHRLQLWLVPFAHSLTHRLRCATLKVTLTELKNLRSFCAIYFIFFLSPCQAMNFKYWKLLGEEFIVVSNINSWVRCRPSNETRHTRGSLTTLTAGDLKCTNIHDAANVATTGCSGIAPDSLSVGVYGPSLSASSLFYCTSQHTHADNSFLVSTSWRLVVLC